MQIQAGENSVSFRVRVTPRSSREGLGLDSSGEVHLGLHAAAVEGQANEACIEFFSRKLRLPKSAISIAVGERSRRKLIRVTTREPKAIAELLRKLIEAGGVR